MITNFKSVSMKSRKISFRIVSLIVAVAVAFSAIVSTLVFAGAYTRNDADGKETGKGTSVSSFDGITEKLCVAKSNVCNALAKAGIDVDEDVIVPVFEKNANGFAQLKFTKVRYEIREEVISIKYETETVYSDDMFVDDSEIVTKGENGEKVIVHKEKYVDGKLVESAVQKETVNKEPVNEVKKVGTKKREVLSAYKNTVQPMSELEVPADLKLDANGIPVDYKYCVEGKATAYTGDPATASGRKPMPGHIAVDPREFPYGTELYVVSADGSYVYGYCVAADTGGFVKMGNTDIDLYMDNRDMCYDWGNRGVKIYVL